MMKRQKAPELPQIADEPGMAERFERGLRRAFTAPHQLHAKPTPKVKTRPASKGRVHKGKTRS